MSRYVSVTLLFAALAALVGAQAPAGLAPAQQARLLNRNRELLEATVNSSLDLTESKGPLERAAACNKLAKVWAGAVEQAVRDRDANRAAEMGGHLHKVADVGIAGNLQIARRDIQPNSPSESELYRRRDEARRELDRVEKVLSEAIRIDSSRDLQALLESLTLARRHIESAAEPKK
jgi:hypothetical protein